MGFPILIAAIRSSGLSQWRVAQLAEIPESRLSRIVRRGEATKDERDKLSRLLGVREAELFAAGPAVRLNVSRRDVEQLAREHQAAEHSK